MKLKSGLVLPAILLAGILSNGCKAKDGHSITYVSDSANQEESTRSSITTPAAPAGISKYQEALAKTTELKDSLESVIANMQGTVNYDSLRATGELNFFNASISEMRLAKNRLDLDLDKLILKDLNKSAEKLTAVTVKMRERKDQLNRFTQSIEKIAGGIKTLVDITSFLAGNGYIKPAQTIPQPGK